MSSSPNRLRTLHIALYVAAIVMVLVVGAVAAAASFFPLDAVINAMVVMRILVQFVAQIAAVALIRRRGGKNPGYRMALYPLPSVVALIEAISAAGRFIQSDCSVAEFAESIASYKSESGGAFVPR